MTAFDYSFGIEEEFFLASPTTGRLAGRVPRKLMTAAKKRLGDTVTSELLQSQIEIASPIFHSIDEAAQSLAHIRRELAEVIEANGLRLIAASTHPLGAWREQAATEKPRYDQLMSDFRIIGQRNLVCGMHVHVAIPDGVDRVALMNRIMPWLPIFLALSTSSPFWDCHVTGLLSYRQAVYDEWPRSGIPDFFQDEADYDHFVAVMTKVGAVKDASYLWWAIRPALKYPTLEMRIADVCTRVEDGVAIAALFRALVATLIDRPDLGAARTTHTRRLIDENRWRAKRDGTSARFIDEGQRKDSALSEVLPRLLETVNEAADRLGCRDALTRLDAIVREGTSAHVQLQIYNDARAAGEPRAKGLRAVVDWLVATTRGAR